MSIRAAGGRETQDAGDLQGEVVLLGRVGPVPRLDCVDQLEDGQPLRGLLRRQLKLFPGPHRGDRVEETAERVRDDQETTDPVQLLTELRGPPDPLQVRGKPHGDHVPHVRGDLHPEVDEQLRVLLTERPLLMPLQHLVVLGQVDAAQPDLERDPDQLMRIQHRVRRRRIRVDVHVDDGALQPIVEFQRCLPCKHLFRQWRTVRVVSLRAASDWG